MQEVSLFLYFDYVRLLRHIHSLQRMSRLQVDSARHKMLARELYSVQLKHKLLLPGVELKAGEVKRVGTQPIGGSAEFDIWEGLYLENEKCTLKVIRAASFTERQRTVGHHCFLQGIHC